MTLTSPGLAELADIVATFEHDLIHLRRTFHAHPELSGEEAETAKVVAGHLAQSGMAVTPSVGGHGVVGVLHGAAPGPVIGCRADMDALPIQDTLDQPYRSLVLGVKHACGHDAHMTIALGTAKVLAKMQQRWAGTVVFLFQPAEESLDGAQAMLEDGVLEQHPIEALLALHAFPLPAGTIGLNTDLCLAGMEEFRVRFYAPSGNLDELVQQAKVELEALSTAHAPQTYAEVQALITRMETDPTLRRTTFLSCWPESAGSVSKDHLLGLVSMADFTLRPAIQGRIRETLNQVVAGHGAAYDLTYTFSNPPLHNDQDLVAAIMPALTATVGHNNVRSFREPYPFAHEDFARFASRVPAVLFWLGTANHPGGIDSLLHTPDYDIDEATLKTGTQAMTAALLQLLSQPPGLPPQTPESRRDRCSTPYAGQ